MLRSLEDEVDDFLFLLVWLDNFFVSFESGLLEDESTWFSWIGSTSIFKEILISFYPFGLAKIKFAQWKSEAIDSEIIVDSFDDISRGVLKAQTKQHQRPVRLTLQILLFFTVLSDDCEHQTAFNCSHGWISITNGQERKKSNIYSCNSKPHKLNLRKTKKKSM